jgi:hypothetical protein
MIDVTPKNLEEAAENLYSVFADYQLVENIDGCTSGKPRTRQSAMAILHPDNGYNNRVAQIQERNLLWGSMLLYIATAIS